MFEKEAERIAVEKYGGNIVMVGAYETGFIEGAEFGYKLAHEEMEYLNKHWGESEEERNRASKGGARMTDEEMAVNWVTANTGFNPKEPLGKIAVRTFLAGLKAGRDTAKGIIAKLVEGIRIISDPKICMTDVDTFVSEAEQMLKLLEEVK